jgi:hypothetical protein
MADPFDAPIVAGEAASLLPAQTLYLKVARIVAQVLEEGKERWPALGWPKSTNDVDEQMLWQFRNHGRFTVPVRVWGPVRLFFGVAQQDSSADFHEPEPHLCVWLEHAPRQVDLRRRLLDAADTGSLGSNWSRRLPGWWALTAHVRLGAFGDHAEAGDWILTRIGELSDAGLFAPLDVGAVMTSEPDEEPAQ